MRRYQPAHEDELQIDLDTVGLSEFYRRLGVLRGSGLIAIESVSKAESKTPGHFHSTIMLEAALPIMERILLQACLGSDLTRELLSYIRAKRGDDEPVLFIEPAVVRTKHDDLDPDDVHDGLFYSEEEEADDTDFACGCSIFDGRCEHMDVFQPTLTLSRYGAA